MGKEELGAAFEKMTNDDEAAERMAGGDFADLGDAELTEAERAMVQAAAGDVPDVEGFAAYIKIDGVDGNGFLKLGDIDRNAKSPYVKLGTSLGYIKFDG